MQKGMVLVQRDLDQAFMQVHVEIFDKDAKAVYLELRPPRLVFSGLAIGSCIGSTRVDSLPRCHERRVTVIPVMDDVAACVGRRVGSNRLGDKLMQTL